MADKKTSTREVVNKRAAYEFTFLSNFEAGIMLQGTEIKSIRTGGSVNLSDAYCRFKDDELYVMSMYISPYKNGTYNNHEARRERKLLLKKQELKKLQKRVKERGSTIVPYRLYFSDRGLIKLEIALGQGKKTHDKRQSIKEKDNKRQMARLNKIRL
ncbi:MAG: SsrA-binding protein SmpB [Bacteroidota bacterium]